VQPHILSHNPPFPPYLLPYIWKRKRDEKRKKREREREIEKNTRIYGMLLLLPPQAMVEQDWTPSTVTHGHLQKLTKQGFMMTAELEACRMPEDPVYTKVWKLR
jgi:hypothetical protein